MPEHLISSGIERLSDRWPPMRMKTTIKAVFAVFLVFLLITQALSQESAEDHYDRGLALMKSGKYREAIPFFDEAIRLNSNYIAALLQRSRARSNNQRDLPGALRDIETILQIDPMFGEAYFARAMLRNSFITQMLKKKGRMTAKELLPFYLEVLEDLNAAIAYGFRKKRVFSYRAHLHSRYFNNQSAAISDYSSALALEPGDDALLINRANAKRKSDDLEGAAEDLREIVRLFEVARKKQGTAEKRFDRLKFSAVMALNNLSSIYALAEKPDEQLWAIRKSIEIQPTPGAFVSPARYKLIYGSLRESVADYTQAIEMSGETRGRYLMDRGIVYLLQGETAKAERDFKKGREIDQRLERFNLKYWLELARRQRAVRITRVELPN